MHLQVHLPLHTYRDTHSHRNMLNSSSNLSHGKLPDLVNLSWNISCHCKGNSFSWCETCTDYRQGRSLHSIGLAYGSFCSWTQDHFAKAQSYRSRFLFSNLIASLFHVWRPKMKRQGGTSSREKSWVESCTVCRGKAWGGLLNLWRRTSFLVKIERYRQRKSVDLR